MSPHKIDRKARMQKPPVHAQRRPPEERVHDFEETLILPTLEQAIAEASRCIRCPNSPCQNACPLHNDIPKALRLLEEGRVVEAAMVYRESNPLPEICGRVCPHDLCQAACTLNKVDKAIDVRRLEAFVTDYQQKTSGVPLPSRAPVTGKKVAVIGAGPAGMTVAERLACKGHRVDVYDKHPSAGGLLIHGIPRFKLSSQVVDAKVRWLEALGINFHYNVTVGRDIAVRILLERYDAVFMGVGTPKVSRPGLDGENLSGVYEASEFLVCTNLPPDAPPLTCQHDLKIGPRIHVLGGGDTAMDCLRTALRIPGVTEVTCYYRRSEAEMPAHAEEYHYAREEGANFEWLACPVRFEGDGKGNIRAVTYQRMKLGEPDESGRCRPNPIPGSEFIVEVDTVVLALGYRADANFLSNIEGLKLRRKNLVEVDKEPTGRTHVPGLFAAGDVVRGPDLVVTAIAAAAQVAETIDRYLRENNAEEWPVA